MLVWLMSNLASIVVGLVLLILTILAVRSIYKNKGTCSGCSGCKGGSCDCGSENNHHTKAGNS